MFCFLSSCMLCFVPGFSFWIKYTLKKKKWRKSLVLPPPPLRQICPSYLWTMTNRTGPSEISLFMLLRNTTAVALSLRLGLWWPSESGTSEIVAKRRGGGAEHFVIFFSNERAGQRFMKKRGKHTWWKSEMQNQLSFTMRGTLPKREIFVMQINIHIGCIIILCNTSITFYQQYTILIFFHKKSLPRRAIFKGISVPMWCSTLGVLDSSLF